MAGRNEARKEFYQDMLNEAPRALSYWAGTEWIDDETLLIEEYGDNEKGIAEFTISVKNIASGWRKLLDLEKDGKWWHCQDNSRPIAKTERALITGNGNEDYDDCVVDAVVQLAVLGEVRYG